jgi:ribosome recycling factor
MTLRSLRDKTWEEIQAKEKEGGMGEDDKFRLKEELQEFVDETNKKLEELLDRKVEEITR